MERIGRLTLRQGVPIYKFARELRHIFHVNLNKRYLP